MTELRDELGARICGLAATRARSGFAWLDGVPGRSWLGMAPAEEVAGESLDLLDGVEQRWREGRDEVWVGWLTYDVGAAHLRGEAAPAGPLASVCLRRYDAALRIDGGRVSEIGRSAAAVAADVRRAAPLSDARWPLGSLRPRWSPAEYRLRVERAKRHIVAGDTYQVNLSQPFVAEWTDRECPLTRRVASLYQQLRTATPAPMGALLDTGDAWIVSNSPETLLSVRVDRAGHDVARSWPIKGTRPRATTPARDALAIAELQASAKDRAEHTMIVDLVRNDLGRVARPGSVRVDRLADVLTLPTVHHLVSEVRCSLAQNWSLAELFASVFPGGSITGAPKRRTVEIIDALEAEPRGVYCGAIVLLSPEGIDVSIPIRTALAGERHLALRSGGGIVYDSDPEQERLETLAKARAFAADLRAERSGSGDSGAGAG
ncbi:MAG: anthranilate synthase component I family protein [Myxococcales bacterium FL481]|nr:MAG: anthranilate synthase component I family protein [Myxococcales bacterium FL481]